MAECYAMLRGSAVRVTGLSPCGGHQGDPVRSAVSKCVVKVEVNEIIEAGRDEAVRNAGDRVVQTDVTADEGVGYELRIEFLRTDPGMISLLTGLPVVIGADGDVVGFDAQTRLPAVAFGLEVWSQITTPEKFGYTAFPFLKGGYLSGFTFESGSVTFTLAGARTQRRNKWGLSPHGPVAERGTELLDPDTAWTAVPVDEAPPAPTEGIVEFSDVVEGGSATDTSSDVLDGEFVATSDWIVEGGGAT